MGEVWIAVAIVGVIGLLAGVGLSVASVKLAVPRDEKAEEIEALLPGANCGACGFSGCSGYAKALSEGKAAVGLCSPGGTEAAKAIAAVLGTEAGAVTRKTAYVACNGCPENRQSHTVYVGKTTCAAAAQMFGETGACNYGCFGFGDCVNVCTNEAIEIVNGVAKVKPLLCGACGKCAKVCPHKLISIIPLKQQAVVACSNKDKGADTRKACTVGCIGCMKCTKVCESGAITVENNVAKVTPEACTNCGKCASVCPVGCLTKLC